jgi:hypothetical protein
MKRVETQAQGLELDAPVLKARAREESAVQKEERV